MMWCGFIWFVVDNLCRPKVKPMTHTAVPQHLYDKHNAHNVEKIERRRLEKELKEFQDSN